MEEKNTEKHSIGKNTEKGWRIRTNNEVYEEYKTPDIIS